MPKSYYENSKKEIHIVVNNNTSLQLSWSCLTDMETLSDDNMTEACILISRRLNSILKLMMIQAEHVHWVTLQSIWPNDSYESSGSRTTVHCSAGILLQTPLHHTVHCDFSVFGSRGQTTDMKREGGRSLDDKDPDNLIKPKWTTNHNMSRYTIAWLWLQNTRDLNCDDLFIKPL